MLRIELIMRRFLIDNEKLNVEIPEVSDINVIVTNENKSVVSDSEIIMTSNESKTNKLDEYMTNSNNVLEINEICVVDDKVKAIDKEAYIMNMFYIGCNCYNYITKL